MDRFLYGIGKMMYGTILIFRNVISLKMIIYNHHKI